MTEAWRCWFRTFCPTSRTGRTADCESSLREPRKGNWTGTSESEWNDQISIGKHSSRFFSSFFYSSSARRNSKSEYCFLLQHGNPPEQIPNRLFYNDCFTRHRQEAIVREVCSPVIIFCFDVLNSRKPAKSNELLTIGVLKGKTPSHCGWLVH